MKVGAVIPKRLRCPHDNSAMEYAPTVSGEPTWTCHECEIDYKLTDLIKEGGINPSFVVLGDS